MREIKVLFLCGVRSKNYARELDHIIFVKFRTPFKGIQKKNGITPLIYFIACNFRDVFCVNSYLGGSSCFTFKYLLNVAFKP